METRCILFNIADIARKFGFNSSETIVIATMISYVHKSVRKETLDHPYHDWLILEAKRNGLGYLWFPVSKIPKKELEKECKVDYEFRERAKKFFLSAENKLNNNRIHIFSFGAREFEKDKKILKLIEKIIFMDE